MAEQTASPTSIDPTDLADGRESLEGGNYELLRDRLGALARELGEKAEQLNTKRKEAFGGTELTVIGNARVRTENNCIPRDIVQVGGLLLFGFNVFLGLKTQTNIGDVFSLHRFEKTEEGFELPHIALEDGGPGFLADSKFKDEFTEFYRYYKTAHLLQLRVNETKLLAIFQFGQKETDIRVFRWALDPLGRATYIDNRGERDHVFPSPYDFEWTSTTREDYVEGEFAHVSIRDQVFVEATGGDLTVKVENNTNEGLGIYREPVDDPNQALDDAKIDFAILGSLILIRILPFGEQSWRYLVFNTRTKHVRRVDAVGQACLQLPEDHGIIFPGGYVLQTGEIKVFEGDTERLEFKRVVRAPNGEDVLYVFHRRDEGRYLLFPYNLVRKEVQNPIQCHGYSQFEDGTVVIFRDLSDDPTRVHAMQIWQTPFVTDEFASAVPVDSSFLSRVGNADLVRGISEAFTIRRLVEHQKPSRQGYEDLIAATTRVMDSFYWAGHDEVGNLSATLHAIRHNSELIIDEFEKIVAIKARAAQALEETENRQIELMRSIRPEYWEAIDPFMQGLTGLRNQRGHIISQREVRYIDRDALDELEAEVVKAFDDVSRAVVTFLLREDSLHPIAAQLETLLQRIGEAEKTPELQKIKTELEQVNDGLDVLSEVVSGLEVEDPTARTVILEQISEVFGQLNRVRAIHENRRKTLGRAEGKAEFAAQFKLFGQSIASAVALADTPEKCDELLSRLLVQLEEIESRFSDFDEFLVQLTVKREEVNDAFAARKQTLLDERQRRVSNVFAACERILSGVVRRARSFSEDDDLNAFFASDPMVLKLRQLGEQLLDLGDSVKSDELFGQLKTAQQNAIRGLRDRAELFEEGADVIKLGRHRFNINTQSVELTVVPRAGELALHVTATDFYEPLDDPQFNAYRRFFEQHIVSEKQDVYRGEYLAASILFDAEEGRGDVTLDDLHKAHLAPKDLLKIVRRYAAERYDEGYERGIHDADATAILAKVISLWSGADLLRFGPQPRTWACLFWSHLDDEEARTLWHTKGRSLGRLRANLAASPAVIDFAHDLGKQIRAFLTTLEIPFSDEDIEQAGRYLAAELQAEHPRFVASAEADHLRSAFLRHLEGARLRAAFEADLRTLDNNLVDAFRLTKAWVDGYLEQAEKKTDREQDFVIETVGMFLTSHQLERDVNSAIVSVELEGLLGQHPRIVEQKLHLQLDEFLARLGSFIREQGPAYGEYRKLRHEIVERERERLRIEEFKPRVMTSFVRNQLINDVYLPLIGDNLAKQVGSAGETKRTDLMGLLLLISPPGYGKTTLMEYIASQFGFVFMKVNGPSLGHSVHSLDPDEAPNATARQEVNKINLAFEMGNNVMLYLDDIQHTHPELLQKFISLCDAQRRVEGVWRGRTRTYDFKGKKFCVVMAGNPYTESGETFKIPDMLANRADIYNLGDILEGKEAAFALSYVENALTSNTVVAPLAGRDQSDIYKLIRMAQGEQIPTTDLSYGYSSVELSEITAVFQRLFAVRDVLLKVNQQYIASASQNDAYRTEPAFLLQGSYRNMNKVAEKVVPAMNDTELDRLINDHYAGEAQTLTTGAENNLLKLKELRQVLTDAEKERWEDIKRSFARVQLMGANEDDPAARVVGQLSLVGDQLENIRTALRQSSQSSAVGHHLEGIRRAIDDAVKATKAPAAMKGKKTAVSSGDLVPVFEELNKALQRLANPKLDITVKSAPPPGIGELLEQQVSLVERTLVPLVQTATKNLDDGMAIGRHLAELIKLLRELDQRLRKGMGLTEDEMKKPRTKKKS